MFYTSKHYKFFWFLYYNVINCSPFNIISHSKCQSTGSPLQLNRTKTQRFYISFLVLSLIYSTWSFFLYNFMTYRGKDSIHSFTSMHTFICFLSLIWINKKEYRWSMHKLSFNIDKNEPNYWSDGKSALN